MPDSYRPNGCSASHASATAWAVAVGDLSPKARDLAATARTSIRHPFCVTLGFESLANHAATIRPARRHEPGSGSVSDAVGRLFAIWRCGCAEVWFGIIERRAIHRAATTGGGN